ASSGSSARSAFVIRGRGRALGVSSIGGSSLAGSASSAGTSSSGRSARPSKPATGATSSTVRSGRSRPSSGATEGSSIENESGSSSDIGAASPDVNSEVSSPASGDTSPLASMISESSPTFGSAKVLSSGSGSGDASGAGGSERLMSAKPYSAASAPSSGACGTGFGVSTSPDSPKSKLMSSSEARLLGRGGGAASETRA